MWPYDKVASAYLCSWKYPIEEIPYELQYESVDVFCIAGMRPALDPSSSKSGVRDFIFASKCTAPLNSTFGKTTGPAVRCLIGQTTTDIQHGAIACTFTECMRIVAPPYYKVAYANTT